MIKERLCADVLQELFDAKKTGALFVSVKAKSENLIRFYFKDGEIIYLNYGPISNRECLDMLDCYDLDKAVFLNGHKAPGTASNLPSTVTIITVFRKNVKKVLMD